MKPEKILEQARAMPEKKGLQAHSATIWELRRKGKTYREIAEFLNAHGVSTDHTAVYRLIRIEGNPLLSSPEGAILIGEMVYESRRGRPLRPFEAGLGIIIVSKLRIIPLKDAAPHAAIWCEAHFELNQSPNNDWLQQLSKHLDVRWNPATPYHLQGRFGFELKFENVVMALVCEPYNLEHYIKQVGTAVHETTKFFAQNNYRSYDLKRMLVQRKIEIIDSQLGSPIASEDDEINESLEWNQNHAKQLTKTFQSIPIPYISK